jgi:hypothetical protein
VKKKELFVQEEEIVIIKERVEGMESVLVLKDMGGMTAVTV